MTASVYAMRRTFDGAIKIGSTANVAARFYALSAAFPGLQFIDSVNTSVIFHTHAEAYAHGLLLERRLAGEWFAVSPDEAKDAIARAVLSVEGGGFFPCGREGFGRYQAQRYNGNWGLSVHVPGAAA